MNPPLDDFLEAEVARAVAPYRGKVSAKRLATLEAIARDTFMNDPVAVALLRAARPRVIPNDSGEVVRPAARDPQQSKTKSAGKPPR